jgi:hypothetical protein
MNSGVTGTSRKILFHRIVSRSKLNKISDKACWHKTSRLFLILVFKSF